MPRMTFLHDDLILLQHPAYAFFTTNPSANGYVILAGYTAVLVDAVFSDMLPAIRLLAAQGVRFRALYLTHRHLAAQAENLLRLMREFGLSIYMHPRDAAHPQSHIMENLRYLDPTENNQELVRFGLQPILFSGHTEGHTVLYSPGGGGTLLAGDAAVGLTPDRHTQHESCLLRRPSYFFNVDDYALRRSWLSFTAPAATVCPNYGTPIVNNKEAVSRSLLQLRSPAFSSKHLTIAQASPVRNTIP